MHPRISVSQASSWNWSLDEDVAFYDRLGLGAVALQHRKLQESGDARKAAERVRETGLRVTNLVADNPFDLADDSGWESQAEALDEVFDVARITLPDCVTIPFGRGGNQPWERSADALEEALRRPISISHRDGIELIAEFTNPLRADVSFVHTLRDALELAWRLDIGVCFEVTACWYERNLPGTVHSGIDGIRLVQLADHIIGTRDIPNRVPLGDGDLPLERIVRMLLDAGYEGFFDIELVGPRVEDEGYEPCIRRSLVYLDTLLTDLGAGPPTVTPMPPPGAGPGAAPVDEPGEEHGNEPGGEPASGAMP